MGKKIKKLVGGLLGGGGGAEKKAAKAQAEAAAVAERARQAQENMQQNFAADLKQENIGQVIAGGTADVVGEDTLKKKKNASTGLASTLGINL